MPETVEKPDDRSVEELIEGLKRGFRQIREGNSRHWKQVKKDFERK